MSQTVEQLLKRLKGGEAFTFERTFNVDRAAIDEGNRTVNVAFASDKPVDQWFGKLCLSMNTKAMRAERLQNGAPLLMDHRAYSWDSQVGVIERFAIGDDGIARADVRFSRSARGEEIFQDVKDGIRQCISVGFMVHEMHLEQQDKKKGDIYRSDDWEPYEISIVAVPADISVGVGRSSGHKISAFQPQDFSQPGRAKQPIETERTMEENQTQAATVPVETIQPSQVNRQLEIVREIQAFGEIFRAEDLARNYSMEPDATVSGFMAAVRAARDAQPKVDIPVLDPQTAAERQGGSELARTLPRHRTITSFKGEGAPERAYRFGMWLLGRALFDPNAAICVSARKFCDENGFTRAMSEGVNEAGGYTVPPEFSNDIIDLREQYGVFRRFAKVVPMGSDTLIIPRRTGGLTPYFVAEAGSITASDKAWDQVQLVAHKLAVLARYSTEVSEDSIIDFASDLAGEIAYAFANKEDECGFNGTGASTYGGITGVCQRLFDVYSATGGVGLKLGTGNAYSELTLTDFEAVVGLLPQYADANAKWFVHRGFYWNVMVKLLLAAGGVTASEIQDARNQIFMGYPVVFSQVLPKTEANSQVCTIFGDLSKAAIIGSRRDTTIMTSEHSRFANDEIEIKGTERFDINVHSVGDTTNAGPVVGLITAAS